MALCQVMYLLYVCTIQGVPAKFKPKIINSIFIKLHSQLRLVSAKLTQTRGSLRRVSASKSGRLRCRSCEALSISNFQNALFEEGVSSGAEEEGEVCQPHVSRRQGSLRPRRSDVRHGRRKDNLSENKIQSLSPEAQKGLQEQLAAARGMSGPKQCNT